MKGLSTIVICLVSVGVLAGVSGCGEKTRTGTGGGAPVVSGVTVESATSGAIPEQVEAVGTVRARNSSILAARIAGTVAALHVREGDRVAKGKLLVTLEAAEAVSGAAGAQAGVEEAARGVEEARSRKALADTTFERYRKLFQEQAVTRQEFDVRQTEKDMAAQGLARAEARLAQAHAGAKAAGTIAGYTRITAPISGVVTARTAEAGMTVFPGTPLLTVEEEGHYRLEVAAPETLSGKVKAGNPVSFSIDGVGAGMSGKVSEVVPAVDPATRTFTVKIDVAVPGLRSGLYGRALFPAGTRQGVSAPKSAVVERGALTSVWVVGTDNSARMRLVKTGRAVGDRVEILSGLAAGERVVAGGTEKVVDGARVEQREK